MNLSPNLVRKFMNLCMSKEGHKVNAEWNA